MKVLDFIVTLILGIVNLFWSYYLLDKIGHHWDIQQVYMENLPFKTFWGMYFVISIFTSPALLSVLQNYKELDKDEKLPGFIKALSQIIIVLPLIWLMSLVSSSVYSLFI